MPGTRAAASSSAAKAAWAKAGSSATSRVRAAEPSSSAPARATSASSRRWILTARDAEVSAAGRALLDESFARREAVALPLEPLTLEHVSEIVDSLGIEFLRGGTIAATLLRRCGGNPLYLLETLKAWLVQGDAGAPAPG